MESSNGNKNRSFLTSTLCTYVNKDRQLGQFKQNQNFQPQNQGNYPFCWAYSIAAAFHLALKRIKYREGGYPTFDEILKELFHQAEIKDTQIHVWSQMEYGQTQFHPWAQIHERCQYTSNSDYVKALNARIFKNGRVNEQVLEENCRKFRLRFKEVDLCQAKEALNADRVLVARFYLEGFQWYNFSEFFSKNPKGVLTRDYINKQNNSKEEGSGHSVVLVSYDNSKLSFINSWGEDWGDGGFFTIQNEAVLDYLQFFDVYWLISDLTAKEKKAYGYVHDEQDPGCQVI